MSTTTTEVDHNTAPVVEKVAESINDSRLTVGDTPVEPSSRTSLALSDVLANEKQIEEPAEVSPREIHGWKWALVVISILSSTFLFALDNTIVADIQPAIIRDFGNIDKLPWLSVGFMLAAASTNLIWGKVYGQFNAKWTYILCIFVFEVGSALCGAAPNMNALIVGRAICGLGGSGMYVGVMTLLSVTTSIQERPMYLGSTGLTWGLGTVLGPIIGGAFTDSGAGWRWSFYINLCIGGLCAPVYLLLIPQFDPRPNVSLAKKYAEMDFVGATLIIGAFTSGVMAVSFGGALYAWNSGQIIALFVVSAVLFIAFGVQQEFAILTTTARRIFPTQFMRSRSMLILFAQIASAATGLVVPLYFIPLYFQFTRGDSALEAGVRLLPYVCLMVFACLFNGAVMSKYGLYMPWYLVGGIFTTVGGALMYTVKIDTSTSFIYGSTVIIGLGTGFFVQASFSVAQGIVTPEEIPLAVGFITCGQITGVTIAIAIANSIFLNKAQASISALLPTTPAEDIQGAIAGVGSNFFNSLDADTKFQVLDAIVESMRSVYILVITAGALAVVMSLAMKRERLFLTVGAGA